MATTKGSKHQISTDSQMSDFQRLLGDTGKGGGAEFRGRILIPLLGWKSQFWEVNSVTRASFWDLPISMTCLEDNGSVRHLVLILEAGSPRSWC